MDLLASNSLSASTTTWEVISNQNNITSTQQAAQGREDSVQVNNNVHRATLLKDEDVDSVLNATTDSIASDPYSAMYAHSGLDAARVAALLA